MGPYESADCNNNGILDEIDIADSTSADINNDSVPDECQDCNNNGTLDPEDISTGTSADVNNDGIPDDCQDCDEDGMPDSDEADCDGDDIPDDCDADTSTYADCALEIVFVIDTSSSQEPQKVNNTCELMTDVVNGLTTNGITVHSVKRLGIIDTSGMAGFTCLDDTTVLDEFGLFIPNTLQQLDDCSDEFGAPEGPDEQWGPAVATVAQRNLWSTKLRVIVPISDEGPRCGDLCNDPGTDRDSITNAIAISQLKGVRVFPITTNTDSYQCLSDLASDLATQTGGTAYDVSSDGGFDNIEQLLINDLASILSCDGDLNGDCEVDGSDLGLLLGNFGGSGQGDINGDGNVDGADLGLLLGAFGSCAESPIPPSLPEYGVSEQCMDYFEWTMENGTTAEKENFRCWMAHYLSCHCDQGLCHCPPSDCPGSDPCDGH